MRFSVQQLTAYQGIQFCLDTQTALTLAPGVTEERELAERVYFHSQASLDSHLKRVDTDRSRRRAGQ